MRFFLIHDGGIAYDGDYSNASIVDKYKKNLQAGIGNLTSRITRSKFWDVRKAVVAMSTENARQGFRGTGSLDSKTAAALEALPVEVAMYMDNLNPRDALRAIANRLAEVRLPSPQTGIETFILTKTDEQVHTTNSTMGLGQETTQ
jgi:methionyl-tRNA synthetase